MLGIEYGVCVDWAPMNVASVNDGVLRVIYFGVPVTACTHKSKGGGGGQLVQAKEP
jgi:hypothetical protein